MRNLGDDDGRSGRRTRAIVAPRTCKETRWQQTRMGSSANGISPRMRVVGLLLITSADGFSQVIRGQELCVFPSLGLELARGRE